MPQTSILGNSALGIRLQGHNTGVAPGETLTGQVFRSAPAVSPDASLRITLRGRAKSKYTLKREDSSVTTTYRGRWDVVYPEYHTRVLYQGPLHIASDSGEKVWDFALVLPSKVITRCAEGQSESSSFVPLDASHSLPPTFEVKGWGKKGNLDAFVEYWLHAELSISKDGHTKTVEAMQPFTLRNPNPGDPNGKIEVDLSDVEDSAHVTSFRLTPGMGDAKLSFSQKMKQWFRFFSSSIPRFEFNIEIDLPSRIELDGPDIIPFNITFTPNRKSTSESIRDVPQKIKLTRVSLTIRTTVEIICEDPMNERDLTRQVSEEADLHIWDAVEEQGEDIFISCMEESEPVDIGKLISLRVGPYGRIVSNSSADAKMVLRPGFATYNIRRTHKLLWGLRGEIAAGDFGAHGQQIVTLIPKGATGLGDNKASK
ncbi:hypothetical protein FDECE_10303 [Fusarium decemcellulare]|nr:hypothetical protein FDECE_10303 [Fusarium decemcellulare]